MNLEDFMKAALILITLMVGQMAFAQSMREIRIRESMQKRVTDLIAKTEATQELLERRDVQNACKNIKSMYSSIQDHVQDIHSHLDIFSSRVINGKQDAIQALIILQRNNGICKQGKDNEYVDPKKAESNLKSVLKTLKKQSKLIKKADINEEENSSSLQIESSNYEYSYEYKYHFEYSY